MANKGAIKKITQSGQPKIQSSQKPKIRTSSRSKTVETEQKTEDKKPKTDIVKKNILPDKNPLRLRQQNGKPSTKLEPLKISKDSAVKKKSVSGLENKTEKKLSQTKSDRGFVEKRGISTVYFPADNTPLSEFKRGREKSKAPSNANVERRRSRSRTLDPSEVKVLKPPVIKKVETDNGGYEDDFEDYESDFNTESSNSSIKEDTGDSQLSSELEPIELQKKIISNSEIIQKIEEEHMLDSGHFELAEARKRAALVESLLVHREKTPPIIEVAREDKQPENKSLPSSTDEGFEDSRSGDFTKSPPMLQNSDKKIVSDSKKRPLTRGQVLMNMIKLDTVEWTLYESPPISYEEFISTYGKLNTQQVCTQTKEDNLEVETQTDEGEFSHKWTQFPVTCRTNLKTVEDLKFFQMEHVGVGSELVVKDDKNFDIPYYDVLKLSDFVGRSGKVMLTLLEEKEHGGNILQNETHGFPFSEGSIKLSINSIKFLCGKSVTLLHYSNTMNKILLSIHSPTEKIKKPSDMMEILMNSCVGCIWNVNEPSKPVKIIYSQNEITAACFHSTNNNIVMAGLKDGSLCLWDLQEEQIWHKKIQDKVDDKEWIVRSPTYTTAGSLESQGHLHPIVALRVLSKSQQDESAEISFDKFVSVQICSMDEEGVLIMWTVLRSHGSNVEDLGLSPWGRIKLVRSQELTLNLKYDKGEIRKEFVDMNVDSADANSLYIAVNDTDIFYTNCIGGKNNVSCYKINDVDYCGATTCIEVCPFKKSYFFAGCTDGSLRLHSLNIKSPHLRLKNEDSSVGIKNVQWSRSKPLTIYVLDNSSRIYIWDLSNSDICPTYSTMTKSLGTVRCISLSPCNSIKDMANQYIAVGTDSGVVEIHKLSKNFYNSQEKDLQHELNTFLRYVSIL